MSKPLSPHSPMPKKSTSKAARIPVSCSPVTENRWDWSLQALLAGLLIFMLLNFGAVDAWSELVVILAALTLSVGLVLRTFFDADFRIAKTWAYLPLALILGLIGLQMLPLPTDWVAAISPKNVELRVDLLSGEVPSDTSATLSLYPYATAHDLRLALVFVALFAASASLFRSPQQIKRALTVLFVIGCAEAAIGLLQIVTLSHKIHWMFAERGGVITSGSFINYSHFCQFVNLSLGTGLALLLVRMKEDAQQAPFGGSLADQMSSLSWQRYRRLLAGLVLCAVAVLTSMSRNGAISMFAATTVVGLLLYWRGALSTRGWLLGMAPWCVLGVLFFTSFNTVYERLATLEDDTALDFRLEMTAATLRAWQDFPLLGSGLGTFADVFPMYDTAVSTTIAGHADNDWAQLLEEFGIVGAIAVLAFLATIATVAGKLMLQKRGTLSIAAFGLSVGLIATAIHSLSDFGQHLPAVFFLTALLSGLVVAIARCEAGPIQSDRSLSGGWLIRRRLLAGGVLLVLAMVGYWAGKGAIAAHRGEVWINMALGFEDRIALRKQQASEPADSQKEAPLDAFKKDEAFAQAMEQDYIDMLVATEYASEAEPNNVRYAYLLNLYRWQSISQARDPETGNLLLHPDVMPFVSQIAEELRQTRALCPTYGPPCGLEGELRYLVLGQEEGALLIQQAAKLAAYHAPTCFAAGQLAASQGKIEEAAALLRHTVQLEPRRFAAVAAIYLNRLQRSDLAEELAGDHPGRLRQLADLLSATNDAPLNDENQALAERLREKAMQQLRNRVETNEASANELAQMAAIEIADKNLAAGIQLYRRALGQQYNQIGWRLALARSLKETGEINQAMREARICLRLRPGLQAAKVLIGDLSLLTDKTNSK